MRFPARARHAQQHDHGNTAARTAAASSLTSQQRFAAKARSWPATSPIAAIRRSRRRARRRVARLEQSDRAGHVDTIAMPADTLATAIRACCRSLSTAARRARTRCAATAPRIDAGNNAARILRPINAAPGYRARHRRGRRHRCVRVRRTCGRRHRAHSGTDACRNGLRALLFAGLAALGASRRAQDDDRTTTECTQALPCKQKTQPDRRLTSTRTRRSIFRIPWRPCAGPLCSAPGTRRRRGPFPSAFDLPRFGDPRMLRHVASAASW